jgi:hypothetical protein
VASDEWREKATEGRFAAASQRTRKMNAWVEHGYGERLVRNSKPMQSSINTKKKGKTKGKMAT